MRQKFTLITLGVKDFQKALAFYEGLGWEEIATKSRSLRIVSFGWDSFRIISTARIGKRHNAKLSAGILFGYDNQL